MVGWRALRAVSVAEGLVAASVVIAALEVIFFKNEAAVLVATISLGRTEFHRNWYCFRYLFFDSTSFLFSEIFFNLCWHLRMLIIDSHVPALDGWPGSSSAWHLSYGRLRSLEGNVEKIS